MSAIFTIDNLGRSSSFLAYLCRLAVTVGLVFLLAVGGCVSKSRVIEPMPKPVTRSEAIRLYNANVTAIPPFKANIAEWEISVPAPEEGQKPYRHKDMGGVIFYSPQDNPDLPANFYVQATAPFESQALVVGSNAEEFWVHTSNPRLKRGWWGKYANVDLPCSASAPISPQDILTLVGLRRIPDRPDLPPYPLYKVLAEHNVIEYIVPGEDGLLIKREIIIDRRTNLPLQINVYDSFGRKVGQSDLDDYRQIGEGSLPRKILISEPSGDALLRLKLGSFRRRNPPQQLFQKPSPEKMLNFDDYRQIDGACHEN